MSTFKTHTGRILEQLIAGKAVASNDIMASNSNQYFGEIKKKGIALVEVWVPNNTNSGRHKKRSLYQSEENIKRAKKYLTQIQSYSK